jgi:hypothetical protein
MCLSVCPRLYVCLCVPGYMSVCVYQAMEEVRQTLGTVLQGHMTDVVVKAAQSEGADMVYFDDFLGNGDIGPDNKTKEVNGDIGPDNKTKEVCEIATVLVQRSALHGSI